MDASSYRRTISLSLWLTQYLIISFSLCLLILCWALSQVLDYLFTIPESMPHAQNGQHHGGPSPSISALLHSQWLLSLLMVPNYSTNGLPNRAGGGRKKKDIGLSLSQPGQTSPVKWKEHTLLPLGAPWGQAVLDVNKSKGLNKIKLFYLQKSLLFSLCLILFSVWIKC